MNDDNDMIELLTDEILNEKTIVSFHKRPVETMVAVHKERLGANGHTIIRHKNYKDGSHEILHKSPNNNLRVTIITQAQKRGLVTKVTNKPAPASIRQKIETKK